MNNCNGKKTKYKKWLFLLPALITGILVFSTISHTEIHLREIPERLVMTEEAQTAANLSLNKEEETTLLESAEDVILNTICYPDGVYTGQGECYDEEDDEFYYFLDVSVTVEEGKIVSVEVVKSDDYSDEPEKNEKYIDFVLNGRNSDPGIPEQLITSQSAENIDAVSGATYSSEAILGTIRSILPEGKTDDSQILDSQTLDEKIDGTGADQDETGEEQDSVPASETEEVTSEMIQEAET